MRRLLPRPPQPPPGEHAPPHPPTLRLLAFWAGFTEGSKKRVGVRKSHRYRLAAPPPTPLVEGVYVSIFAVSPTSYLLTSPSTIAFDTYDAHIQGCVVRIHRSSLGVANLTIINECGQSAVGTISLESLPDHRAMFPAMIATPQGPMPLPPRIIFRQMTSTCGGVRCQPRSSFAGVDLSDLPMDKDWDGEDTDPLARLREQVLRRYGTRKSWGEDGVQRKRSGKTGRDGDTAHPLSTGLLAPRYIQDPVSHHQSRQPPTRSQIPLSAQPA